MAKRLSSMFSSSKDDSNQQNPAPSFPGQSSAKTKLTKNSSRPPSRTPSEVNLQAALHSPLPPPPLITDSGIARPDSREGRAGSRRSSFSSRPNSGSRPQTPTLAVSGLPGTNSPTSPHGGTPGSNKGTKRKSWLPGRSDKNQYDAAQEQNPSKAWVAGLREHMPYNLEPLLKGEKVSELWDDKGDVIVYIYPESSGKGASFRVSSSLFTDSHTLSYLTQPAPVEGQQQQQPQTQPDVPPLFLNSIEPGIGNLSLNDAFGPALNRPRTNSQTKSNFDVMSHAPQVRSVSVKSVHLPLDLEGHFRTPESQPLGDDLELVVLYRNFFAFLSGGALIATPRQNSLFSIFLGISTILKRLQYGNDKGSSWGAIPWASFSKYTDELRLADVRTSREKNIEAIVLGEAMKSWPLYNEGFVHAVGRLEDIKSINSPKLSRVSPVTMNRLERSNLDLKNRLSTLRLRLDNFEFPSMFSGIANSQTAAEAKLVSFKAWKASFIDFRGWTIAQYKRRYGAWPPKASSKKNNFEESGLNRLLLREVYEDFTNLYDMLVDRMALTTRSTEMSTITEAAAQDNTETIQHALRRVESEYDRSIPPVNPPIPFDVPLIPAYSSSFNRDHVLAKKNPMTNKKLVDNEVNDLLLGSYNRDSVKPTTFCQEFLAYERKLGHGKVIQELVDVRCGQWLFIYAVLQALPLTVVDARDLKNTEGAEHLLCVAPRGGRPWMKEDFSQSRSWYNVASGGGLVSLPSDAIDHSVEGIYRRSHCWTIANEWAQALGPLPSADDRQQVPSFVPSYHQLGSPFLAPAAAGSPYGTPGGSPMVRPMSSGGPEPDHLAPVPRVASRTSMNFGLEPVAPPSQPSSRPTSTYNPNITFDAILGGSPSQEKTKKKKK